MRHRLRPACGGRAGRLRAAFFAADRAVQTHGGMGYAVEYQVERWFRESRLLRIAPVSEEQIMNYVAGRLLSLPRSY
jgi:acyl-CoA dehydrogenase